MKILPKIVRLSTWISLLFMTTHLVNAQCSKRLMAFYPEYNSYFYDSSKIPYNELTHICDFSIDVDPSTGNLVTSSIPNANSSNLVTNAHNAGVKVLITVGGSNDTNFSAVAANSVYTANFASQLYTFISNNNYDGVDIDWEFPQSSADRTNADSLFQAIRNKFNANNSSLLIAMEVIGTSYQGQWVDYTTLNNYLDYYDDEAYSAAGSWNDHTNHNCPVSVTSVDDPSYYTVDESCQSDMDYLITTRSVPSSKINLGMPFYGVKFPNQSNIFQACGGNCTGATSLDYYQIVPLIGASWSYNWDNVAEAPYLTANSGNGFITYENAQSVTLKTNYALTTRNVGGVFAWEITADYTSGTQPLMSALYSAWQANCPVSTPTSPPTFTSTPTATCTNTPTNTGTVTPLTSTPTPTNTPSPTPFMTGNPILYPNPVMTGNSVNISVGNSSISNIRVQVFTVAMRKVQDFTQAQQSPGTVLTVPLTDNKGTNLANGLYYLVITTNQGKTIDKLLVLK